MLRPLIFALVCSSMAMATTPQRDPNTTAAVITYSLPSQPLALHEPVILHVIVKNNSDVPVRLDLGEDRKGGYQFWVTPPGHPTVQLGQYRSPGFSRLGLVNLAPGRTFLQELVLDEWYDFPSSGNYEVGGKLRSPIIVAGNRRQQDPGFQGLVKIGPRDDAKLRAVCGSLVESLEKSQSYAESLKPALALSYVKDPVAVPYLKQALFAHKMVEQPAINGLARIGNSDAISVLAETLTAGLPGDASILARAALQKIEAETTDHSQRATIARILKSPGT